MDNQTERRSATGGIGGKLTDKAVKAFVGKSTPGKKLADGGGLHLFITPAGGATWRVKFRIEGKEKLYSVGPYPLVSLAAARVELREVKALLLENKDPVTERRVNRAATAAGSDNTSKAVAQEWLTMKQREWSAVHYSKSRRALERDRPRRDRGLAPPSRRDGAEETSAAGRCTGIASGTFDTVQS